MLAHGIPPDFRGGVHLRIYLNRHTPLGQCRLYRVTQLRTNDVHCRESAGTGPVVLKVVPVTGAVCANGITWSQSVLLYTHLLAVQVQVLSILYNRVVVVVVVSHIQRIGCQPEKTTLHGGQSRSWSAEQGKENKRKSLAAYPPPPHPPHCSFGENK